MAELLVITGSGAVSPAGVGGEPLVEALDSERPLIGWATRFEPAEEAPGLAAETPDFDLEAVLGSKKGYLDPTARHLLAAAALALQSSRLDLGEDSPGRDSTALVCGAGFGPLESMVAFQQRLAEKGARLANPVLFNHVYMNAAPSLAAIEWGIRGPNATLCAGWTSGFAALSTASDLLALGRCRAALAGGSEALSAPLYAGLWEQGLLAAADDPAAWTGRGGIVPGEGAGALVLERSSDAMARGARVAGILLAVEHRHGPSPREALRGAFAGVAHALEGDTGIDVYLSADSGIDAWAEAEAAVLTEAGLAERIRRTLRPGRLVGELFSALGPIGVLALLSLTPPGGVGAVAGLDPSGGAGVAVVRNLGGMA